MAISLIGSVTTNSGTDDRSFSHTQPAGSNRVLLVSTATFDAFGGGDVTAVTYNGVSLTHIITATGVPSATLRGELWYLPEASLPSDASHTIAVTVTGTFSEVVVGAYHLDGCEQVGIPDATATASSASAINSYTGSISPVADDCMLCDVICHGSATSASPTASQTERFDLTQGGTMAGSGNTRLVGAASGGPFSLTGTFSGVTGGYAHAMVAFEPAAAAADEANSIFFGVGP